jgi:molybdenum cofactor cytidylyltransferase
MKKIYAVILAAGSSDRLGFDKLTLKIDGSFTIRRSVEPFLSQPIRKVFVVAGAEDTAIREALNGLPVSFIHNLHSMEGMSSSIKASLPLIVDAEGVFFHLGDKPFIQEKIIEKMIDIFLSENAKIVVPLYHREWGHPVLIDIVPYKNEIELLKGDVGLRGIIEKHHEDVLFIEGDEGNIIDIDTAEEIAFLRERGFEIEEG